MSEEIMVRVGPSTASDGTQLQARSGKFGEQVVSQCHGKYFEAASRATVFFAADQNTGLTHGTTISTTAFLVLYNPQGSGKRLVIHKVTVAYKSGTLGSGVMYHCMNSNTAQTAPSVGTLLTSYPTNIGSGATAVGVVRIGATVVAPTAIMRPLMTLTPMLASSVFAPFIIESDLDGEIVIEPGCTYQIQSGATAGTSPIMTASISWEEVTIVA